MPLPLLHMFVEFEILVNDQVFSVVAEIEDQVANMDWSIVFEDGHTVTPLDLQIYPKVGRISFKVPRQVQT